VGGAAGAPCLQAAAENASATTRLAKKARRDRIEILPEARGLVPPGRLPGCRTETLFLPRRI
jgi:hypothetical protein